MKHLNINVYGKVQGVFYRASSQKKANDLGLCGFALNKSDGSVYIEVEGEDDKLQKMVDWCKSGPVYARVEKVDVNESELRGFVSFEIKRNTD